MGSECYKCGEWMEDGVCACCWNELNRDHERHAAETEKLSQQRDRLAAEVERLRSALREIENGIDPFPQAYRDIARRALEKYDAKK